MIKIEGHCYHEMQNEKMKSTGIIQIYLPHVLYAIHTPHCKKKWTWVGMTIIAMAKWGGWGGAVGPCETGGKTYLCHL